MSSIYKLLYVYPDMSLIKEPPPGYLGVGDENPGIRFLTMKPAQLDKWEPDIYINKYIEGGRLELCEAVNPCPLIKECLAEIMQETLIPSLTVEEIVRYYFEEDKCESIVWREGSSTTGYARYFTLHESVFDVFYHRVKNMLEMKDYSAFL